MTVDIIKNNDRNSEELVNVESLAKEGSVEDVGK